MDITTQKRLYRRSLFLSASVLMVGILLRILHIPSANFILGLAYLLSLGYILIGLFQVIRSSYWGIVEKFLWTFGFLLLPFIVGFIYYHAVIKTSGKV